MHIRMCQCGCGTLTLKAIAKSASTSALLRSAVNPVILYVRCVFDHITSRIKLNNTNTTNFKDDKNNKYYDHHNNANTCMCVYFCRPWYRLFFYLELISIIVINFPWKSSQMSYMYLLVHYYVHKQTMQKAVSAILKLSV